jgi:hypothetical protein
VRFWQALITAQMAAGFVWADRYREVEWVHLLAEAGSMLIGAIMWVVFKRTFGADQAAE